MTSQTKKNSKKWSEMNPKEKKVGCIGSIILVVIIFFIFKSCFSSIDSGAYPSKHFYEMTNQQKKDWFLKFKDGSSDREVNIGTEVEDALKSQFDFPDEVKFKHWVILPNASSYIIYDSSIVVIFNGELTAKNRFGNNMLYHYSAAIKLFDSTQEVIKADIY